MSATQYLINQIRNIAVANKLNSKLMKQLDSECNKLHSQPDYNSLVKAYYQLFDILRMGGINVPYSQAKRIVLGI